MTLFSRHFVVLLHTTQAWNHLPLCLRSQQIQYIISHVQMDALFTVLRGSFQDQRPVTEDVVFGLPLLLPLFECLQPAVTTRSIHHQQCNFHVHHWLKPTFLTHLQAFLLLTIFCSFFFITWQQNACMNLCWVNKGTDSAGLVSSLHTSLGNYFCHCVLVNSLLQCKVYYL